MRIIFGTTELPPDSAGVPYQRWVHVLVKGLVERGHQVAYWCLATPGQENQARHALQGLPVELHTYPPAARRRSTFLGKLRTIREPFGGNIPSEMRRDFLRACARGYDILQVENIHGGASLALGMSRVLASVHVLHLVELRDTSFFSWKTLKTKLLYWHAEKRLLRRFRHIRVLSDRMARIVEAINPAARVYTIPIAIDPTTYAVMVTDRPEKVVGLIGHMGMLNTVRASTRLLGSIWPRIRRRVPDAQLLLAGWGARTALAHFPHERGVTIVENLPDAQEFFARCAVLAYPLAMGAGLHGKILEAMAYGVPVVTTTPGVEGVDAKNGEHLFVEDDDDLFAERVIELLQNPSLRAPIAEAGRRLVEEKYSPARVVSMIETVYQGMLNGG